MIFPNCFYFARWCTPGPLLTDCKPMSLPISVKDSSLHSLTREALRCTSKDWVNLWTRHEGKLKVLATECWHNLHAPFSEALSFDSSSDFFALLCHLCKTAASSRASRGYNAFWTNASFLTLDSPTFEAAALPRVVSFQSSSALYSLTRQGWRSSLEVWIFFFFESHTNFLNDKICTMSPHFFFFFLDI